jgi:hypothetical protein
VSIFGLFKGREERTLLRALGVIDEVLPERGELTVRQYTKTFAQVFQTSELKSEADVTALYKSGLGEIERVQERLGQIIWADLAQLKVTVFDLGIEGKVNEYINAGIKC